MNKEEILQKSRNENKNQDLYTMDVQQKHLGLAMFPAIVLALIFYLVDIIMGKGINCAFFAIIMAFTASMFFINWKANRLRRELFYAILYTITTLFLTTAYIISTIRNI